jgi:hypothetical protein
MNRRLVTGAAVLCAALAWIGQAAAAGITKTVSTATYRLTLDVGPGEAMYTRAQVKASHPRSGEVMLGGTMSTGGHAMAMEGGMTRHLEVHVLLRSSGKPVTGVMPAITLTDASVKGAMASPLHVVAMEGIGKGISDLHYGNNVALTANHVYKVVVTLKRQRAELTFRAS